MTATRLYLVLAALFGAAGVTLMATGAHAGGGSVTIAGEMLLFHAPAVMAGAIARKSGHLHGTLGQIGLAALIFGTAVFSADLALRGLTLARLFPMAAPVGGTVMIAGWLALAVAALWNPSRT